MQTQLIDACNAGLPWLERYSAEDGSAERTTLPSLPFSVGRIESADLQIFSSRVSREHAVIVKQGDTYRIRDLGSTNGTFVNGQQVEEAPLNDGDTLAFADAEFTFRSGDPELAGGQATHVMTQRCAPAAETQGNCELIGALRRMHELLLNRGFETSLRPILDLDHDQVFGFHAVASDEDFEFTAARLRGLPLVTPCHLTERFQQSFRVVAVEQFLNLNQGQHLFVRLSAEQPLDQPTLISQLSGLRDRLGPAKSLVLALAAQADCDPARLGQWRNTLGQLGVHVAYCDFAGSGPQLKPYLETPPDYLMLSSSMLVHDVSRRSYHQRQLATVLQACTEVGCRAIVTGVRSNDDEQICRQLGFRLVQRDAYANRETSACCLG